jgi:hypothetical protein
MSSQAAPGTEASIFTNPDCPTPAGQPSAPFCQQIDPTHAVSYGTSFSSPIAAGAVAVMFQNDPTLTQADVLAGLQGGAHRLRGAAPFADQSSVGEVDVLGSIEVVQQLRDPATSLPQSATSWLTPGADFLLADGTTPLQVILELRASASNTASGPAPPADGFAGGRLAAYALVDGQPQAGGVQSLVRRGPGVWVITVSLPPGLGGRTLTVGATFDGVDIADPVELPIATDAWTASYPTTVSGGCSVGRAGGERGESGDATSAVSMAALWAAIVSGLARGPRRRRPAH